MTGYWLAREMAAEDPPPAVHDSVHFLLRRDTLEFPLLIAITMQLFSLSAIFLAMLSRALGCGCK